MDAQAGQVTDDERKLVDQYTPTVHGICRDLWRRSRKGYFTRHYDIEDVAQVGFVALVESIRQWLQPGRQHPDISLETFVSARIRNGMREYMLSNSRAVQVPADDYWRARRGGRGNHMTESRRRQLVEGGYARPLEYCTIQEDRRVGAVGRPMARCHRDDGGKEDGRKLAQVRGAIAVIVSRLKDARRRAAELMKTDRFPLPPSPYRLSYQQLADLTGLSYRQLENLEGYILGKAQNLLLKQVGLEQSVSKVGRPSAVESGRRAVLEAAAEVNGPKALPAIILAATRLIVPEGGRPATRKQVCAWTGQRLDAIRYLERKIVRRARQRLVQGVAA